MCSSPIYFPGGTCYLKFPLPVYGGHVHANIVEPVAHYMCVWPVLIAVWDDIIPSCLNPYAEKWKACRPQKGVSNDMVGVVECGRKLVAPFA